MTPAIAISTREADITRRSTELRLNGRTAWVTIETHAEALGRIWTELAVTGGEIRIVHYDATGEVYWAGYGRGHDGQGWTLDESEALVFHSADKAEDERHVAIRCHPWMRVTLVGDSL